MAIAVEVVRSRRRTRTVGARMVGGVLRISVPSWMSPDEEQHWVEEMTRRYERRHRSGLVDLEERAAFLARRYDLPTPSSIRWVDRMETRWGSCTPATGAIRLSTRVAAF